MNVEDCPKDPSHGPMELLSTTSQWDRFCAKCGLRYNRDGRSKIDYETPGAAETSTDVPE